MTIPPDIQAIIEKHQTAPPVDVSAIANELGVTIFSTALKEGVSGVLLKDPAFKSKSGFVIMVARNEPAVRQRFTAAHELGHFVLHREFIGDRLEDNYLLRSSGLSNWQEVDANKFAADLLMPFSLLLDAMSHGKRTPEELAQLFQVSTLAMQIRLGIPT